MEQSKKQKSNVVRSKAGRLKLLSKESRTVMAKLGFTRSDLQPLRQREISVPTQFSQWRSEYIQQKIQYSSVQRQKRKEEYWVQFGKSKAPHHRERFFKSESGPTSFYSETNQNLRNTCVSHYQSKRMKKFTLIPEDNSDKQNRGVNVQRLLGKVCTHQADCLTFQQKKQVYWQALHRNSDFSNKKTRVFTDYKKKNMLLRPTYTKTRMFNLGLNVKSQQARNRRQNISASTRKQALLKGQDLAESTRRIGLFQQTKRLQQMAKRQSSHRKTQALWERRKVQSQLRLGGIGPQRKALDQKLEKANMAKAECAKMKIKCNMGSYIKMEEVTRNLHIEQRRILAASAASFVNNKPRSRSHVIRTKKYRLLGLDSQLETVPELPEKVQYHSRLLHRLLHLAPPIDFGQGEKELTINNHLSLDSFVARVKACVLEFGSQSCIWDGSNSRGLLEVEECCREFNTKHQQQNKIPYLWSSR